MNRIIRVKQEKGFTIIPNHVFKSGLSLRAIGLLTYILHLPDDWVLYKTQIFEVLPKDGKDAIQTAWKELEAEGFIIKKRTSEGVGRGKLPEISYFVYDSPNKVADFSVADIPPPNIPQRKKGPLLSTNKPSTKKQSTKVSLLPNGNNEPPVSGPAPGKDKEEEKPPISAPPPKDEKKKSTFTDFIAIYDEWYKKFNDGIPPNYANGNANAAKAIINYLRTIVSQKAKAGPEVVDEAGIEGRLLESWGLILKNWSKLEPFLQNKTRLVDINSNIQIIIQQVRNGKQKTNKQPTGGDVTMDGIASALNSVYPKA
jgi:hypothetical protein